MRHVTRLGTGSSIVRHVVRVRGRGQYSRKRFVIATLLATAVGVQLVTAGRYTIAVIFGVGMTVADVSSTDNYNSRVMSYVAADHFKTISNTTTHHFNTTSYTAIHTNDSAQMMNRTLYSSSVIEDVDEMGLAFNMTAYDASVAKNALRKIGNRTCFVEGLDDRKGTDVSSGGCLCKNDWFGTACSVPGFIDRSPTPWSKDALQLRARPRRVVYAFPFSIEFDLVELRFAELADVVDVFLILESNYTAYGTPKPLHLLERLRNGTYPDVAGKVVHVFLDYFPPEAHRDGWVADALHRNHLGSHGLRRLGGLRADDLLVLTDADELPRRQLLSFLRWHHGYSEPVMVNYRFSVFGFFWGRPASNGHMVTQKTPAVVTIAMAVYVFRYQLYGVRNAQNFIKQHAFDVQVAPVQSSGSIVMVVHSSGSIQW